MRKIRRSGRPAILTLAGVLMLVAGLTLGLCNLLAGQQIGEFIWKQRGYPYDLGPELLFWARRGLVAAGALMLTGAALLLFGRSRRR